MIYIFTIFSLSIGSFLNALIHRLHSGESMLDRSQCPKCQRPIAWYDNIPVLSYVFLLGKCRHCQKPISIQYPLVEIITAVLFAYAFYNNFQFFSNAITSKFLLLTLRDLFLISVLIIVFVYDLRWYLILDIVTLPAIVMILILNLLLGMNWQNILISGIIGLGFFLLQFVVSRGKWIGGGDLRLGLLMGVSLGFPNIIIALMIAYVVGAIFGLGLIALGKKKMSSEVPFGTFLSLATIVTLFWGENILNWYLEFIGL